MVVMVVVGQEKISSFSGVEGRTEGGSRQEAETEGVLGRER